MNFAALKSFQHWSLVVWFVIILAGATVEGIGIFRHQDATFTAIVKATVPKWLEAGIIGWLTYHFLIQK